MTGGGSSNTQAYERIPGAGLVTAFLLLALLGMAGLRFARPVTLGSVRPAGEPLPQVRVEINTASAPELTLLPGIGPSLADRIVLERDANGGFDSVDELARVGGIGPGIVARVTPYCAVESISGR